MSEGICGVHGNFKHVQMLKLNHLIEKFFNNIHMIFPKWL